MNRHERRKAGALKERALDAPIRKGPRQRAPTSLPPARADGRPLYFEIGGTDRVHCFYCLKLGVRHLYTAGKAFMNDPANSPEGTAIHTICHHHLPDNAVIYNPHDNKCRDKTGTNVWEEDSMKQMDFRG